MKKREGKFRAFIKGGAFFALLCLMAKGIGALYRIPLTNIMGAEGIGLYQIVFPLYSVLLTVSGGGLPSAISKTVSSFHAEGAEENARRTLYISLAVLTAAGAVGSALLFFFRGRIAALQGNPDAAIAYVGIAPAVVLVSVISCFRGYFQGKLDMLPSGISQVVEQVVKMIAGLVLCSRLLVYGVPYAALGALLGVSISELAACAVLLVQYAFDARRRRKRNFVLLGSFATEAASDFAMQQSEPMRYRTILRRVLAVALPVTLGSLVLPLSSVIDSILVINLLTALGESVPLATKYYGILNGPVGSLVNMPVVITTSLSVMLLPKVARLRSANKDAGDCVEKFIRICFLTALVCALALSMFSREILGVLYRRTLSPELLGVGSDLLKISSLTVLYMSLLLPASSVLQGCDKAYKPALNLLFGASVKALLTIALIRIFGIIGASVATVSCFALTCILDVYAMRKAVDVKFKLFRTALSGVLGGAAFVIVGKLLAGLFSGFLPAAVALVAALAIAAVIYVAVIFLAKGIERSEIFSLSGGGKSSEKNSQNY
ncbi:MAG: polysaccharide biosynthesis protein [Clostridia bacterium]|nr:polysaccharide biosynthesis protein [Clostridia bacterium]